MKMERIVFVRYGEKRTRILVEADNIDMNTNTDIFLATNTNTISEFLTDTENNVDIW